MALPGQRCLPSIHRYGEVEDIIAEIKFDEAKAYAEKTYKKKAGTEKEMFDAAEEAKNAKDAESSKDSSKEEEEEDEHDEL